LHLAGGRLEAGEPIEDDWIAAIERLPTARLAEAAGIAQSRLAGAGVRACSGRLGSPLRCRSGS